LAIDRHARESDVGSQSAETIKLNFNRRGRRSLTLRSATLDMSWAMYVGQVARLAASENAPDRERDRAESSSLRHRVRCSNPASLTRSTPSAFPGERLIEAKLM
jgi:hypothetical protein